MKKYWKQLVVLLLVALLISQFNISQYFRNMSELRASIWINLLTLQLASQVLLLIQYKRISSALGKAVSYRQIFAVNMKGVFYETITPGLKVGGEVAKGYSLVNEIGFTTSQATALVVIQKSISIFALVFLSILSFILINTEIHIVGTSQVLIFASLIAILVFIVIILLLPERFYSYLAKHKNLRKIGVNVKDFLEKYTHAFEQIKKNKKEIFIQLLISILVWTLFPFKLYYIVNSLGLELSFIRAFAVTMISYMAGMVPLLPGGFGSFEGTMTGLLLLWGVSKEEGLIIATLFRFVTFWLIFFVSLIYLTGRKAHYRLKGA